MHIHGFTANFVQSGDEVVVRDNNILRKGVVLYLEPFVYMGEKTELVFVKTEDGRIVKSLLHTVRRLSTTGLNMAAAFPRRER